MKTALLMGGDSPEREVSLMSGGEVLAAMRRLGIAPLTVDPAEDKNWLATMLAAGVERVFNILHGGGGENGETRGALNCVGLPSTGSDVLGSALAMNKHVAKQVWRAAGVPTPDWRLAFSPDDGRRILAELPLPLFVKPACGGSSARGAIVRAAADLPAALSAALAEPGGALAERLVVGGEYTLSTLNDKPLPLIRIDVDRDFYDYEAKYVDDGARFSCPCGLPLATERRLAAAGMRAFRVLQCSHWGRVDFILGEDGAPQFLEVNAAPGLTSHSLAPQAARAVGMTFDELVAEILSGATRGGR